MSLVRRNIFANFPSKFWVAIATYVLILFHLKLLGEVAYGMIGSEIATMPLQKGEELR